MYSVLISFIVVMLTRDAFLFLFFFCFQRILFYHHYFTFIVSRYSAVDKFNAPTFNFLIK